MKFRIEDFDKRFCMQMDNMGIFFWLHKKTNGNPCETNCAWYAGGTCPGYKRLTRTEPIASMNPETKQSPFAPKTNKQIADEHGITKRQVAKLRKSGELAEFMEHHRKG